MEDLLHIPEPQDYFTGLGAEPLPTPRHILFFIRRHKADLQQHDLRNRSHHRCLLCFNFQTEGYVHLDHHTLLLKPGQALVILPYQFHHYSQLASPRLRWLFCSFELEDKNFLEPLRNLVISPGTSSRQSLEALLREWHAPHTSLQPARLQSALLHLLLCLREDGPFSTDVRSPASAHSLIRRINRLLEESAGQPLTVSDLAGRVGYSDSRLRVLFKQAAGIPLGAYIQNYRITRAIALLRTTQQPVAAVAEAAGFASPQAFSRIFKQCTGLSPRAYRSGHPRGHI